MGQPSPSDTKQMTTGWAGVVAQLEEQSLPTPEICGSNPNIGKKVF